MYKYEEPSLFSGRRGAPSSPSSFSTSVIVWAFYVGLGRQAHPDDHPACRDRADRQAEGIDKPPPPPPKLEEIKPYVPPPEFVDIQAPQVETTAITQTPKHGAPPPAPVAAPVQHTTSRRWIRSIR
jgi:hypothetical protein